MSATELDPIIAGFQAMRDGWGADATVARMRADFEAWCERFPDERDASLTRVTLGGVPAAWIGPPVAEGARSVLYFHGGGYSLGSARSHLALGKRIAFEARARVALAEYRLAPEHPFPAAIDDAVASYHGLVATGVAPEQIAVAGDSAGAGLALALLVALRDGGVALPACAVLLSPFADLACRGESYTTRAAADPIVSREMGLGMGQLYLAGRDPGEPLASPVNADLAGLPPLLIQVGGREVVLDDARAIEAHARAAGVAVTLDVWPDMIHVWHLFASALAAGRCAIEEIGAFVQRWTK
jgi:acetyl esterase/lipase